MSFKKVETEYTPPENFITAVMDTVGDGTGTTNAIGNYSATETIFKYTATKYTEITGLSILAGGTGNVAAANYVTLSAPLTNGIGINVYESDGTPIRPVNLAARVKTTVGWISYAGINKSVDDFGGGENYLSVYFDATKIGNICLTTGRYLGIILNDDFTDLSVQTFTVQGKIVD